MAESPLMLPGSRKDRGGGGGGYLNNNNNNNNNSDCCCCKPDPCDSSSQGTNDDRFDRDLAGLFEDRFRVDRRKLEQMLQGQGETFEVAEDFFQRIMDETNTQITWPSKLKIGAKSKKDPHIKVIGVPIDVKMAKDKIMSILDTKSNRVTLKMDVSHTDHSHVIGKGGNNIKKVMQATGCHIHFPDSNRGNNVQEKSNQVSIAGQPSGVENARTQIRELLPLVFIFELSLLQPYPDPSSSTIQQLQQMYNVTITFKQRPRTYVTTITVRGSVYNAKAVKEATMRLMEHLISNIAVSLPVSMQLEIAPQHHLFMIGRGGMNVKQIMQRTGASVHFPDPNTVSPQRKGTVYITGGIESVYQARQQLIGCLPLVLMFDIKEDIEIDQAQITQLMEQLDVFISVKPKPKQPSKSVIVKSVERNAANMYAARLRILGLDKDERTIMSPGSTTSSNGTSGSNDGLGLSSLGVMSPSMLTVNTSNTLLMVNGQHNPPLVSPASSPSPTCPGQWLPPPPGVYGPMMVVNSTSTASLQCALDVFSQCNGLQKGLPHSCAFSQCEQDSSCSNSKTSSPNHLHNDIPGSFSSDCNTTGSIQSHHNIPVDLKGINCSDTFEKIVNRQISPTSGRLSLGLLDLGKPPLTSLPKTQSMVLDAVSLASSDRSSESGNDSEGSDKRAPGSERKKSAANLFPSPSPFAVDYEQKKLLATKAMQKKPVGESRIPTDIWSGMGFSKSMPESAIRDRFGQSANCNRMCGMLMAYQNSAELPGDMDQDPWKDSKPLNAPMNPAPGEFPSPRKRYEFGLSNSNHVDSTTLPTKTLWSPKIDLAELFSELGLGKYTDLFQQQEIDLATFMTMNDDDLRLLGISTFGARRKMLLAIADLHNQRSQLSTVLSSNNPFQENGALWLNNRRPDIGSLSGRW